MPSLGFGRQPHLGKRRDLRTVSIVHSVVVPAFRVLGIPVRFGVTIL